MFDARAGTQRRRELRDEPGGARGPVLALDLGGTQIRTAAVHEDGSIAARKATHTPVNKGPGAIVEACRDMLVETRNELRATSPDVERDLVGISISSPGPIDPWRGVIVEPPNLGPEFRDIPIAEPLEAALGLPAYLERDTQIAALGEGAFGAAQGSTNYVYVTVSSGVGGAIVTEGRLLMGPDGTAGELGHIPVDFHGPPCGCGGIGHLESFASGVAIARAGRRAIGSANSPDLEEYARTIGSDDLDARQIAGAEDAGVETAHEIMEEARRAFAAACVGFVDVFDPDLIVVGGSIAQGQGDRLLGPAREAVANEAFRAPARRVRIVPAALGDDVSLVGGLVLVHARAGDDRWRGGRLPIEPARVARSSGEAGDSVTNSPANSPANSPTGSAPAAGTRPAPVPHAVKT
jgi:glucokinase